MNKRIDLTQLGGFPFTQDVLDFMQTSYREAFKGLALLCGDKTIISGVVVSAGAVSNGWISYNGELIPFIGGSAGADVVVEETSIELLFEDGVNRPVLFTKVAYFGSPATFAFNDLARLDSLLTMMNNIANHAHSYNDLDDLPAAKIVYKGSFNVGNIASTDSFFTVSIPDQPDANYTVMGALRSIGTLNDDNDVFYVIGSKTINSFQLACREIVSLTQSLVFDYIIVR